MTTYKCHKCGKEISELSFKEYDKSCYDCFSEVVERVVKLAEESIKMLENPKNSKFTEDERKKKLSEEKQRLKWTEKMIDKLARLGRI
ncbi:MAG: hypothetical protein ACTSVI_09580 [Promethearchaeota archaeon]